MKVRVVVLGALLFMGSGLRSAESATPAACCGVLGEALTLELHSLVRAAHAISALSESYLKCLTVSRPRYRDYAYRCDDCRDSYCIAQAWNTIWGAACFLLRNESSINEAHEFVRDKLVDLAKEEQSLQDTLLSESASHPCFKRLSGVLRAHGMGADTTLTLCDIDAVIKYLKNNTGRDAKKRAEVKRLECLWTNFNCWYDTFEDGTKSREELVVVINKRSEIPKIMESLPACAGKLGLAEVASVIRLSPWFMLFKRYRAFLERIVEHTASTTTCAAARGETALSRSASEVPTEPYPACESAERAEIAAGDDDEYVVSDVGSVCSGGSAADSCASGKAVCGDGSADESDKD